tara:strand:- start:106 stop:753 length:648 start_codon:yes stop_codon:yes gene_type:complete
MRKIIYILVISFFWACSPEELIKPYPCIDGSCGVIFEIDTLVSPNTYQDANGYWHVEYYGLNYFTIKGELDLLDPEYVINGVPLIETSFDSDYWVAIDSIRFTLPIYSVLSWFTNGDYNNPINIGDITYTLNDLSQNHPPLNIVGYQIQKNFCWECPYAETLLGTYSKYNYNPKQQIFLDNEMVGDTLKVMTKTIFNNDVGFSEIIENEFNIIID